MLKVPLSVSSKENLQHWKH